MKGDLRIYKYVVAPFNKTAMPAGAHPLQVGQQGDEMVCWAVVDPDAEIVQRDISGFPTGALGPPRNAQFINTVQRTDGLVFHFFDIGESPLPAETEVKP